MRMGRGRPWARTGPEAAKITMDATVAKPLKACFMVSSTEGPDGEKDRLDIFGGTPLFVHGASDLA
jgi:hypothetical protein